MLKDAVPFNGLRAPHEWTGNVSTCLTRVDCVSFFLFFFWQKLYHLPVTEMFDTLNTLLLPCCPALGCSTTQGAATLHFCLSTTLSASQSFQLKPVWWTNWSIHFLLLCDLFGSVFTTFNFDLALTHCNLKWSSHCFKAASLSCFNINTISHYNKTTNCINTLVDCFQFVVAVISVYLSPTLESGDFTSVSRAECRTVWLKTDANVTVPLSCKGTGSRKLVHTAHGKLKGIRANGVVNRNTYKILNYIYVSQLYDFFFFLEDCSPPYLH